MRNTHYRRTALSRAWIYRLSPGFRDTIRKKIAPRIRILFQEHRDIVIDKPAFVTPLYTGELSPVALAGAAKHHIEY